MIETGGGPGHEPKTVSWGAADQVGAMNFAFHIVSAIVARNTTGRGQKVECSQLGAFVQFQSIINVGSWNTGKQRNDGKEPSNFIRTNPGLSFYQCGDGKWLTVAPSNVPSHFPRFCKAVGLEWMLEDERFKNQMAQIKNR